MKTIFIHESSKTLNEEDTEEHNLSYKEQIEKAKNDCVERGVCNTMSPIYLQAFKLYADMFDVLARRNHKGVRMMGGVKC